jgi:hypothetical protein
MTLNFLKIVCGIYMGLGEYEMKFKCSAYKFPASMGGIAHKRFNPMVST